MRVISFIYRIVIASQLFCVVGFLYGQNPSQQQKEKVDLLNEMAWKHSRKKNDSSSLLLNQALTAARKEHYKIGEADALNNLGLHYMGIDDFKTAQDYFFKALSIYEAEKKINKIASCNNNIGNLFIKSGSFRKAAGYYSDALEQYYLLGDSVSLSQTCNNLGAALHKMEDNNSALKYFEKGLKFADSVRYPLDYSHLLLNKGSALQFLHKTDSAAFYYRKALSLFRRNNYDEGLCAAYFDIGYNYEMNGAFHEAADYYRQSLAIARRLNKFSLMDKPLEGLMMVHNRLKNNDSVEYYYYELVDVNALLFEEKTHKNILDVETKYQTEKKEQALALEREVNEANRQTIFILAIAVALALALILGVWAYQNQKQQIITLNLRQKSDEIERMIQEQQAKAYESQLEGEAQERKRIASELHDRVGGLLATLNLHFEVLTEKKTILEEGHHIQQLIKASIEEVRTISHNLHGIGQSQGLFNSLKQLRKGINSTGRIEVSLFYELGDIKLPENVSSELYKIVQELTTNTLKHAKAEKITIQLSMIENVLHLVYEDDGLGFDMSAVKKGMGISNIGERVERCNGDWHVDSTISRGTTVIVNIPLEK